VRLFYFAPSANAKIDRQFGRQLDMPALRNKVLGVSAAVRQAGVFVTVVSALAPQAPMRVFSKARIYRSDGVCFAEVFSVGRGALRRIVASYSLLRFSMAAISKDDRVIFYNFFPEHLLSALFLRLRGRTPILDIEDAPDESGAWTVLNRICFSLMKRLCAEKYLTVSRALALKLNLKRSLVVYGVANYFLRLSAPPTRFARAEVNVHYGGAVAPGTGRDMFIEAVRILVKNEPRLCLHFHVTGFFDPLVFSQFTAEIEGRSRVKVFVYGRLTLDEYRALMETMDIGLSLKLPSSSIGQVTFPSKVVEITALGLLLCSTSVSDVPDIFNDTSAVLLKTEDAWELAEVLSYAIRHRSESAWRAQNGHSVALQRFSSASVGTQIATFLRE
jgi:hypothetical protein